MALLLLLHPVLRKAWNRFKPNSRLPSSPLLSSLSPQRPLTPEQADGRLDQRLSFDYIFAIFFLVALHGISAAKVLLILWTNYKLATGLPRKYVPAATWLFNIGILFANELTKGCHLMNVFSLVSNGRWHPLAHATLSGQPEGLLVQWGFWLDGFSGIMPRWEILFNLTVLRLISFNLDYYWSRGERGTSLEVSTPYPLLLLRASSDGRRRSSWIPRVCRSATASRSPPSRRTLPSATTSLMPSMRRCTSPAPL